MEIVEFSKKEGLMNHFLKVRHQNKQAFAQDCRELSARKLKMACEAAEIEQAEDKISTIDALTEKIAKEVMHSGMGKGKKKKESKKIEEVKGGVQAETTEAAHKEATPAEAPVLSTEAPTEPPTTPEGLAADSIELKINPKYKKMVERPSAEQYEIIKNSIKTSGLQEKIRVLPDMTIWDGHTRYQICQELGLPITSDDIEITDIPEEKIAEMVFIENLARRQLSNYQKLKMFDKFMPKEKIKAELKEARKKKKGEKAADKMVEQAEGGFLSSAAPPAEQKKKKGVRERRAEKTGLSASEIRRYDWCKQYIPHILEVKEKEKGETNLDINEIYAYGQELWKAVKKWLPEEFEKVKTNEMDLVEANTLAMQKAADAEKVKVVEECVPGPMEKLCLDITKVHWKTLEKKYTGQEGWTPDEFEADFIARLNVLTEKYQKKNA